MRDHINIAIGACIVPRTKTTLFEDDFSAGLATDWAVLANDGVVTRGKSGIIAAPAGRSPTDKPAFTMEFPQPMTHLKWLVSNSRLFGTDGGELRFYFEAAAKCFGVRKHPFGNAVVEPDADLRLAAGTLHALDFSTGMIFDFWITNTAIYPFYERIPVGSHSKHQAFSSIAPPVTRTPDAFHRLCIAINATAGTARWEVDGKVVGIVKEIGFPAEDFCVIIDHGGSPQRAVPKNLAIGVGLLTLLDAASPDGTLPADLGLVDLAGKTVRPNSFRGGPTLFGQGASIELRKVEVSMLND